MSLKNSTNQVSLQFRFFFYHRDFYFLKGCYGRGSGVEQRLLWHLHDIYLIRLFYVHGWFCNLRVTQALGQFDATVQGREGFRNSTKSPVIDKKRGLVGLTLGGLRLWSWQTFMGTSVKSSYVSIISYWKEQEKFMVFKYKVGVSIYQVKILDYISSQLVYHAHKGLDVFSQQYSPTSA